MKQKIACLMITLILMGAPLLALAETDPPSEETVSFGTRLAVAGAFFGRFLLVMGVIFAVLLLTKRIAGWVDKKRGEHKE